MRAIFVCLLLSSVACAGPAAPGSARYNFAMALGGMGQSFEAGTKAAAAAQQPKLGVTCYYQGACGYNGYCLMPTPGAPGRCI